MNTIIFDFDGTIADSFDQVLAFLLHEAGRNPADMTVEQRAALKGLSMKDLARKVGIPQWRLPFVYFKGKAALTSQMRKLSTFNGMDEVLQTVHNEQYRLFIISSNSRRNIDRFLTEHGLSGYFVRVYANAGWFGKGRVLRMALKQNKLDAATTVYVGDEVRDIVGAHAANMPSIAVNWGFSSEAQLLEHSPTVLVRTPAELQKALIDWGNNA